MSAILVQVHGEKSLLHGGSKFKLASEILADTRSLLKAPTPRAAFLTVGVLSPDVQLAELLRMTSQFPMLMAERAAGLHAGRGPSRDVVFVAAVHLRAFLAKLAESQRIRPYLEGLPTPPETPKENSVLVDELAAKLEASENPTERSVLARSLFLVLPDLGESAPEWIDAFERVSVAPTDSDINLLLTVLERSVPVRLQRASAKGKGLSVVVRPGDPFAAPVAPHLLRRSLHEIADQWQADAGVANGRLESGSLDLPPLDFVHDLFTLGPAAIRDHLGDNPLTAHEVWPFVAASAITRGKSTPGPFWFLVRMTEDLGQLASLLRKAFKFVSGKSIEARQREVLDGLAALRAGKSLAAGSPLVMEVEDALRRADTTREGLAAALVRSRGTERAVSLDVESHLLQVLTGEATVGEIFDLVLAGVPNTPGKMYWARTLAGAATDTQDRHFLAEILNNDAYAQARTAAKKAIRLIDAIDNGPQMDLETA